MKRVFIPAALGSLLVLAACSKGAAAPPASAEKSAPSPLEGKLDRLILPKVLDPTVASLEEAVEYLRVKTREVDTDDSFMKGVNFVIIRSDEAKLAPALTQKLSQVPLREALRDISEQHGMKYRVDSHAVVITPKDSVPPDPMPTEADAATEGEKRLLHHLAHRIHPSACFQGCYVEEAIEYSRGKNSCHDCAKPPPVPNFVLHLHHSDRLPKITLDLRDIPELEMVRYIAEASGLTVSLRSSALVLSDHPLGLPPVAPAKRSPLEVRASQIMLPTVYLYGATLDETLEFLHVKTRQLDPQKQDVNIAVRAGGGTVVPDLDLKDISLLDALDHIALQSGHRLSSEGETFVLTPVGAAGL